MSRSFVAASSQYLETSSFPNGVLPVTIAAWFRPDSTSGFQRVVSWQSSSGQYVPGSILLNYPSAGNVSNQVYDGFTNALPVGSGTFTTSEWNHAAVISAVTASRTYLNGAVGSDVTYSALAFVGSTYLEIGRLIGTQYYHGRIAEVGVWSAELTAAEVSVLAKGYTPLEVRPQSLIAYYPLGGHYGNYDLDRWKNRYDLTPANSPTWAEHSRVIYPATHGVWPLAGQAAPQSYELTCDPASIEVSGQSVSLLVNRTLSAGPAQISVSGQIATLTTSRVLTANAASVSVTGQAAGLVAARTLTASPASVEVTGQSATLTVNRVLTCEPATIQVSGQAATLCKGLAPLVSEPAQIAVSGQAATLRVNRLLTCVGAAIQVAGQVATLSYSGSAGEVDYSVTAKTEAIARRLHTEARATQGRT